MAILKYLGIAFYAARGICAAPVFGDETPCFCLGLRTTGGARSLLGRRLYSRFDDECGDEDRRI